MGTGCNGLSQGINSPGYVTPGRGAALPTLTETDIAELMTRRPASQFPARIMIARVQGSGYRSYVAEGYGYGRYSVVTTRDIEEDGHFDRLAKMPMVLSVATMNRMLYTTRPVGVVKRSPPGRREGPGRSSTGLHNRYGVPRSRSRYRPAGFDLTGIC